ncbi:MAG: hypothetical protein EVA89_25040 [Sandaracinaceae bacterium]|nr:MAG: hypothetical protein EVA89_25040 [Sandaracinaceae bacterium]
MILGRPRLERATVQGIGMVLMLTGCSCAADGHDCVPDGSSSCDSGYSDDSAAESEDAGAPRNPFCDLTYSFVEGPDFRHPATGEPALIPPSVPVDASGAVAALRLEVGETGLRSWWVRDDVPLQLSLGLSVGTDISSVPRTVRILAMVNGRIGRVRRADGEWEDVLAIAQPSGVTSLVSTIEIERGGFEEGLNSLSLVYVIETPTSATTVRTGTFPNLNVFIHRTGRASLVPDNDSLELSTEVRLRRRPSFVTLGEDGRMVAHLQDPDLLEPEGLWVHAQSTDVLADCGNDNAMSVIALLDGQPIPLGPEGATSVLVSIGPTERLAFRLPTLDLPSDAGHSLLLLRVEGVGHPFEADDGWLSPWVSFRPQLFLLEW